MTYRFKLTEIFKFKEYSVFPVRSNRVEQIAMEIAYMPTTENLKSGRHFYEATFYFYLFIFFFFF